MKKNKKILKVFYKTAIFGAVIAMIFSSGAFAVKDNGCGKEDHDYINPIIALCSTHVYNKGGDGENPPQNPETEEGKQLVRDIVALKTTIITQQMDKQYKYLEATIKRLKIQLEKAILTAQTEAANNAAYSSGGAGSYSGATGTNGKKITDSLPGAMNCFALEEGVSAADCLKNNLGIVLKALDERNTTQAYNQLNRDLSFAMSFLNVTSTADKRLCSLPVETFGSGNNVLHGLLKNERNSVQNCANMLLGKLSSKYK